MSENIRGLFVLAAFSIFAAVCAGCASDDGPDSMLTRRQRDSVLAESRIPGARGVKTTITVADSANARTDRLNELAE